TTEEATTTTATTIFTTTTTMKKVVENKIPEIIINRVKKEDLYSTSYKDKIDIIKEEFEKEKKNLKDVVNESFNYSPGIVSKTELKDIIIDSKTGVKSAGGELIIKLKPDKTDADFINELKSSKIEGMISGYIPTFNYIQVVINNLNDETLNKIRKFATVKEANKNYVQETFGGGLQNWHITDFNIENIWKITRGKGVKIAILDTGFDMSSDCFTTGIIYPYSVITQSAIFEDGVSKTSGDIERVIDHGTKVASVIGGYDKIDKIVYKPDIGVAPDSSIIPIQVLGYSFDKDKMFTTDMMILEGIARAIAFNADIINLSVGTDYSSIIKKDKVYNPKEREEINKKLSFYCSISLNNYNEAFAECEKYGIWVVCSAGNDSMDAKYQPLANHHYTLSAGSINWNGQISGYSNFGNDVDCYAPGEGVPVVAPGNNIFSAKGTSFSAPFVSGILALIKSTGVDKSQKDIISILRKTNLKLRLSILPDETTPVFYPEGIFKELGINITPNIDWIQKEKDFFNKYGKYFIGKQDTDIIKFDKIAGFYVESGKIDHNKNEFNLVRKIAADNFNYAVSKLKDNNKQDDYFISIILSKSQLAETQKKEIINNIKYSDYFSIICNDQYGNCYNPENNPAVMDILYEYEKRLDVSSDFFNSNSIIGLGSIGKYYSKSYDILIKYLDNRIDDSKEFLTDEIWACNSLSEVTDDIGILTEYVGKTYNHMKNRHIAILDENTNYLLYSLLLKTGFKDGLTKVRESLIYYDGLTTKNEILIKKYQGLLNRYTDFGIKYDYLADEDKKAAIAREFSNYIENCVFINGRFVKGE
ncbi:MAG TPA: S8 family serine peptidase, partial [Spirochaetota bacterium]|nr:S8 family serine peptidase [Spirochaetota bacterium]